MVRYLGLDIGATSIRAHITTGRLEALAQATRPTPQGPTAADVLAGVTDTLDRACREAGLKRSALAAVGIGSFGPLDTDRGRIRATPNLDADLRDVPVVATVRKWLSTDAPVVLSNDAVAGVVAEQERDRTENLAYLTLSSGVGAGVVIDGHVLRGHDGTVAEVGHFVLAPGSDRPCGCGGTGHWEAFCGGENIPAYAAALAASEGFETTLFDTAADVEGVTAADIFEAYGEDELATATVERVGAWNAQGTANLIQAFAPERIAVGGSVALENEALVLDPIRERVGDHLVGATPEIGLTPFGDSVVVRGALVQARRAAND
jgi:glucokinase